MSTLVINVTNRCNLNCPYCFGPSFDSKEISIDEYVKKLESSDEKYVVLTGGEPLLHKNISEFLRIGAQMGKNTILHTNGILLTKEFIDENCCYIYRINLPIDSIDHDINSRLRGNQHLDKFFDAIDVVKSSGIRFSITTTLTRINFVGIENLVKYISEIKPNLWRIFQFNAIGKAGANFEFEVGNDALISLEAIIKNYDINFQIISKDDKTFYSNYRYSQL